MKVRELQNILKDVNPDAEVELLTQDYTRICDYDVAKPIYEDIVYAVEEVSVDDSRLGFVSIEFNIGETNDTE